MNKQEAWTQFLECFGLFIFLVLIFCISAYCQMSMSAYNQYYNFTQEVMIYSFFFTLMWFGGVAVSFANFLEISFKKEQ